MPKMYESISDLNCLVKIGLEISSYNPHLSYENNAEKTDVGVQMLETELFVKKN